MGIHSLNKYVYAFLTVSTEPHALAVFADVQTTNGWNFGLSTLFLFTPVPFGVCVFTPVFVAPVSGVLAYD